MARYVASVDTLWERERAFDYLADFANIQHWDPSVPRARRLSDELLTVGDNARDGLRRKLAEVLPDDGGPEPS